MYLQLVNGYAFGETLRMLLWISVPLVVIFFLITTWFNHRKEEEADGLVYAVDGGGISLETGADPERLARNENSEKPDERVDELDWAEENENMYKGILWLKEKYEQYRELSDQRYERVKEELLRSEKKYQELVATLATPPGAEESAASLKAQLKAERLKVEELTAKLQQNTELLMSIYKELDKSLYAVSDRV